jgi:predicted ATP-grasp superfamily ATP-dependent carboligase
MRILVLDGNQNQAVAAVRSLAHAGHTVLAGDSTAWSKAGWSRSCHGTFRYPAPQGDALAFVSRIADLARLQPGTLIMPMTEATTLPLSAHRETIFKAGGRMVLPAHADLLRACDKEQTTRLAASLGLRVPKTIPITSPADAQQAATSVQYPVVLKPRASEELSSQGQVRTTGRPSYASTPAEFESAYRDLSRRSSSILVQEFVRGEGAGYFALLRNGELRAEFAHRRIRDVYPTGSGSAVRMSVKPEPQIREAALAMLRALNWHGVAMVEFRREPGKPPVFIEVNGRFWHSLALACHSGVDFPALLAEMAEKGDVQSVSHYQTGVRCRWFLGDFRHLVEVWRGAPRGYPEKYPGRLGTLTSVLTPVPGTFHDLFAWNDPLPELGDWLHLLRKAVKRQPAGKEVHAQGRYSHP